MSWIRPQEEETKDVDVTAELVRKATLAGFKACEDNYQIHIAMSPNKDKFSPYTFTGLVALDMLSAAFKGEPHSTMRVRMARRMKDIIDESLVRRG